MNKLEMLIDNVWVPFDADMAATESIRTGSLTTIRIMTAQEIMDEFGNHLSTEEINQLKSKL